MSIFRILYEKISSIRLTILICILLALISLVGTIIPQNLSFEEYHKLYGPGGAKLVSALGLTDLYHSRGFFLLLLFFTANLIACTANRLPGIWRALQRERSIPSNTDFKGWRYQETFRCSGDPEQLEGDLAAHISKAFGKGVQEKTKDRERKIFFLEQNRYARLGPYVVHLGIFLVLFGGLTGILFGFKGFITLNEGSKTDHAWSQKHEKILPFGFSLQCNRFIVNYYPDGTPKDFRSEVSLIDKQGSTLKDTVIRVNHPLTHQGITFYQSTYGENPKITLKIKNTATGEENIIQTGIQQPFPLPGENEFQAIINDFNSNFRIPEEMVRLTSFPRKELGPAVRLILFNKKGFGNPFWVFKDFPNMGKRKENPYLFTIQNVQRLSYTGLQVVKDPGATLVWAGCILMVIGFFISFLLDHEIIWVTAEHKRDNQYVIHLVGRAVRHPGIYSNRFEKRKARLKKALSPWLSET